MRRTQLTHNVLWKNERRLIKTITKKMLYKEKLKEQQQKQGFIQKLEYQEKK